MIMSTRKYRKIMTYNTHDTNDLVLTRIETIRTRCGCLLKVLPGFNKMGTATLLTIASKVLI